MPLISVIMPVHNAAAYLQQTLDCILHQSWQHWELICVENGSSDNSLNILRENAGRDTRIKCLTQNPPGAGIARNAGVAAARGKYICFCDADDLFHPEMLEKLVRAAEQYSSEITFCKAEEFCYYPETGEKSAAYLKYEILPPEICSSIKHRPFCPREELREDLYMLTSGAPWGKLFLTSFVQANHLSFSKHRYSEDAAFVFMALALAESAVIVDEILVSYRLCKTSLSHHMINDASVQVSVFQSLRKMLEENRMPAFVITALLKRFACDLWWLVSVLTPPAKWKLRMSYIREVEPTMGLFAQQNRSVLQSIPSWVELKRFFFPRIRFVADSFPVHAQFRFLEQWWDGIRNQVYPDYELLCIGVEGEVREFLERQSAVTPWLHLPDGAISGETEDTPGVCLSLSPQEVLKPLATLKIMKGERNMQRLARSVQQAVDSHVIAAPRCFRWVLAGKAVFSVRYKEPHRVEWRLFGKILRITDIG